MALLSELASMVGGTLHGDDREVDAVRDLDDAGPTDITFLSNPRYAARAQQSNAACVIVKEHDVGKHDVGMATAWLEVADPYLAMARIAQWLHPFKRQPPGTHPSAVVDHDARVADSATISALCYVGPGSSIGDNTVLLPQVHVGRNVTIGPGCLLYPGVKVLDDCVLGRQVILQAGVVIGSDGFGYAPDEQGRRHKIPQLGKVVLEDEVEVGANSTIDRATFHATVIGAGTKIDNQVQLAHNVRTGVDCVVVSQTGVAGSTTLGDRVTLAGQVGVIGHITIGNDVTVGARGAPVNDLPVGGRYSGVPAIPHGQWLRQVVIQKDLPGMRQRLLKLERRLAALEQDEAT